MNQTLVLKTTNRRMTLSHHQSFHLVQSKAGVQRRRGPTTGELRQAGHGGKIIPIGLAGSHVHAHLRSRHRSSSTEYLHLTAFSAAFDVVLCPNFSFCLTPCVGVLIPILLPSNNEIARPWVPAISTRQISYLKITDLTSLHRLIHSTKY